MRAGVRLVDGFGGGVVIEVWVAGKCVPNPGATGVGVSIKYPDGRWCKFGAQAGHGTANTAPLIAIKCAILAAREASPDAPIVIRSHSKYAVDVATGTSEPGSNCELVAEVRKAMRGVTVVWEGKGVSVGNVKAQELADCAVQGIETPLRWGRWLAGGAS